MRKAGKLSNINAEVNFKQEIHSPTESSPVKARKIPLLIKLHAINMQLYQNGTPRRRPQENIKSQKLKYVRQHLSTETCST